MKKILINVSNHPSERWSDAQKEAWDEIVDIPFPNVPPEASNEDVRELARKLVTQINNHRFPTTLSFIMLQGEFTLSYIVYGHLAYEREDGDRVVFVVPTTERKTVETVTPDGKTVKKTVFSFVRWREI